MKDISIVISGAAGQGVQTVEQLLVGILKMAGYHVFATKEYESRVRGGTNSTELRIAEGRVAAFVQRIDLLIPFSKAAIDHVKPRMGDKTLILADTNLLPQEETAIFPKYMTAPFQKIAKEIGNKIFANIVAVGAVAGLFKVDSKFGEKFLDQKFKAKGEEMVARNIRAFQRGIELGKELSPKVGAEFELVPTEDVENEILFNGNQAIALGAIAGGCNFISAYPMSPSTGVLVFLAQHSEEFEIVVDQAEDEIAAVNKAVGAWYAGARAIASTSGGGYALMNEGLSLAGIMESPLVIHIAQRPGPATGLPTRTAQEDLNFARYGGHGEFNRIIFAPGTLQQAFYLTQKAFNLADHLQIPVFVLTDQDFVDAYYNIPSLDLTQVKNTKHIVQTAADYKRYEFTEDGLSPRGVPGWGEGLVRADSDEHDEFGHITEDMDYIRPAMIEKRVYKRKKLIEAKSEMPTLFPEGDPAGKVLLVCWGSNYHVVREAVSQSGREDVAMLHFHQVFPLAHGAKQPLANAKKVLLVENNATGQFGGFLKLDLDFAIPPENQFLRSSGKPWSVEEVLSLIEKEAI